MFSTNVPAFDIDLDQGESTRWQQVIDAMKPQTMGLLAEAGTQLRNVPGFLRRIFCSLYQCSGGLYVREMNALAKGLGVSVGTAAMLNCAYELSHLHIPRLLGCTAGVRYIEGQGMVHVRTLDWPLPSMGPATCVFRFQKGGRQFKVIGVPGQVGALSGMVPGAYSVTINWAPPAAFPTFHFGPTFILRKVLETCDTFGQAVDVLRNTRLSTSVFFTVCGTRQGEACVIERRQKQARVRWIGGGDGVVTQANHHLAQAFVAGGRRAQLNADFLEWSDSRLTCLAQALRQCQSVDEMAAALNLDPVLNEQTVQKMLFCPQTGQMRVWKRIG